MDFDDHKDIALEDPLHFQDLLNGGARFTLQSNFQNTDEDDDLFPELLTGEEGLSLNPENITSPWEQSFAELIPSMTSIFKTEQGNHVYKKVIKQPDDNVEMQGKCRVTVTYAAYWEKMPVAFDSTFMRGEYKTFVTFNGDVLPGLDLAVQSMKCGEESHFILPYDLLYGEVGCPPRIRAKADALFVIQLIKFSKVGDEDATERVSDEDRKKYHVMIDKILEVKQSGIDYFKQGAWLKAASNFHKAITKLEMCHMRNEVEEKEQQNHLITLYINTMTCYNKLDNPKKVCSAFQDLTRLTDTSKNTKALYNHGKALIALGEFQRAKEALTKASRLKPNDDDISQQLRLLNKKHAAHKDQETTLWRRAMGNAEPFIPDQSSEVSDKFKATIEEIVATFEQNDQESKVDLPQYLTQYEIAAIKDLIKGKQIKFTTSVHGKNHYLTRM